MTARIRRDYPPAIADAAESPIRWPDGQEPETADLHAVNELEIDAPRENVWAWLSRPDLWSTYYVNARLVRHSAGPWPRIAAGTSFTWFTFGARVRSVIEEFEPPERIAWSAREIGAHGYHAWVLEKRGGGRCHVYTEETQRGPSMKVLRLGLRPAMVHFHQRWLEGLARVAAQGPPPPPGD